MAFWVLYGKPWFKRQFPNMIYLYKEKLFNDWYNSLSTEDKELYDQHQKELEEQRHKRITRFFAFTNSLYYYLNKKGYYYE